MAYLVLAYPELIDSDLDEIQRYREVNDELYYKVVNPHFTFVFPVFDMDESAFLNEVRDKAEGVKKFNFCLRSSTINKDAFNDYFHTFLVPEEGYSKIVKLHDRLYNGKLKDNLRLDIDFVPHIGIGNSKDKFICKKMVDEWNEREFSIPGTIGVLAISRYEDGVVTNIEAIELD